MESIPGIACLTPCRGQGPGCPGRNLLVAESKHGSVPAKQSAAINVKTKPVRRFRSK